jgi:hypothetical protein
MQFGLTCCQRDDDLHKATQQKGMSHADMAYMGLLTEPRKHRMLEYNDCDTRRHYLATGMVQGA